jgi:AAA+ ATPase superfamily predicted ATPase
MKCRFVGREYELDALQKLTAKQAASLVVVTGRRRIGKSRLAEEFADRNPQFRQVFLAALAPQPGITAARQRVAFGEQMQLALGLPPIGHESWMDLFLHLARATEKGRWIVLLDEVSWMAGNDPEFLPKLKVVWDQHFKKNPELILILCGSVSSWLDANILSSTGFVGRVSLHLQVDELPLPQCNEFWGTAKDRVSAFDKLKLLAVTGGVPRYLEELIATDSVEDNIRRLCFRPEGLLFREFDQIFSELFDRRGPTYGQIVSALAEGHRTLQEICQRLEVGKGGVISTYLQDLILAGFMHRDYTWDLSSRSPSKLSRFRLKDNYLRFYQQCILPHRLAIQDRRLAQRPLTALPGWETMMGLQFENLVLHNRAFLWQRCGLSPSDIAMEGPFFQSSTKRRRGCQIDYLIQTRHGPVYVCEVRYSRNRISGEIQQEMQEKLQRLSLPRHCSALPVLVHANEVSESVLYGDTFSRVIDFSDILRET